MSIDLADYGLLVEEISDMSFRNEAHIKISKAKREVAYTQTVDIVVETIDFSQYENYKSSPPIQFYGYAELVFQDALSLEIPIHFPRQRIYQAYQWEALRQWAEYVPFISSRGYHQKTQSAIDVIRAALDLPLTQAPEAELWETKWIELPLREVHIRLQKNSQFTISYAQYQPVPFDDPLSPIPKMRDGKSNQADGDKDNGLPSGGIQPSRRDPTNPFGGNRPASSPSELAQNGFTNLSPLNLTTPNPFNNPIPVGESSCVVSVSASYKYLQSTGLAGQNGTVFFTSSFNAPPVPTGTAFIVETLADPNMVTGRKSAIKTSPQGKYFNTGNGTLQDGFFLFTSHDLTLSTVCTPIP